MSRSGSVYDAIVAADKKFVDIFHQGNAAALADLYTEEAQFLPPNSDFVKGRSAIQAAFQGLMDMGIKEVRLEALEVEDYGNTATEVGRYSLEGDGGQLLDEGKFVVIWKQEAGQWKLHRDMINTSRPAQA